MLQEKKKKEKLWYHPPDLFASRFLFVLVFQRNKKTTASGFTLARVLFATDTPLSVATAKYFMFEYYRNLLGKYCIYLFKKLGANKGCHMTKIYEKDTTQPLKATMNLIHV